MSSKSNARLPGDPLISIRIAFLRPVAKRVASKTPTAPPVNRARKVAASSTVTWPVPAPDRRRRRRAAPPPSPSARGRSWTKVSSMPLTVTICSPVMCWVRSTMCAPMSPRAPEPALSLSSRQLIGACGIGDPVLEVLRADVPHGADPTLLDQLAGQGDGGHPPVGEADHGADAVGRGPRRRRRPSPAPRRPCWRAASRRARACPRPSAAIAISAWVSPGVQTSTRSMSSRVRRRVQSVSVDSQPRRAAASATFPGPVRTSARSAGAAGGRRSGAPCARRGSGRRP